MYKSFISLIIFMLGLYYIFNFDKQEKMRFVENFEDHTEQEPQDEYNCPDILVQKGNTFYLYNSKLAPVPGVNPVVFSSLEDYIEFLDWQRSQKIRCPVLFLRESYDTQGKKTFNVHPSPTDLQGGLNKQIIVDNKTNMVKVNNITDDNNEPISKEQLAQFSKLIDAGRTNPVYNNNMYAGFDKDNLYIGLETPLDKMYYENKNVSTNPMDPNWGGREYTQSTFKTNNETNTNMLKFKRDLVDKHDQTLNQEIKDIVIIDNWGTN